MRWQGRARSGNIEDRRGMGMALPVGGGIGGLVLLLLFSALTGQNPIDIINSVESRQYHRDQRRSETTIRRPSSCRSCLPTPKKPGPRSSRSAARPIRRRRWSSSRMRHSPPAESASRRWARSTARTTGKVYLDLSFFHDLGSTIRRAGRFRPGVCRGARSRPPCADGDRRVVSRGQQRGSPAASAKQMHFR